LCYTGWAVNNLIHDGRSGVTVRDNLVVQEFARRFEARNKSTNCRTLLGVELIGGDRQTAAARVKCVCPKMVQDAAEILESLL